MRYLVKLFFLLLVMPSFAQVQSTFFGGAFLGKSDLQTTYTVMTDYFDEKPVYLFGILSIPNVVCAGYYWDAVNSYFRNGKFSAVQMRCTSYGISNEKHTSNDVLYRYNNIKQALTNKYGSKYKCNMFSEKQEKEGIYYYDGRYAVYLILHFDVDKKRYYETSLEYVDIQLQQEPSKAHINSEL